MQTLQTNIAKLEEINDGIILIIGQNPQPSVEEWRQHFDMVIAHIGEVKHNYILTVDFKNPRPMPPETRIFVDQQNTRIVNKMAVVAET